MSIPTAVADAQEPFRGLPRSVRCAGGASRFGGGPSGWSHSEAERTIETEGREVLRLLFQGFLDSQGPGATAESVVDEQGTRLDYQRTRSRRLMTIFGPVETVRTGYYTAGGTSLCPRDAELNLPPESYSFETQRRNAVEVARGSFDGAVAAMRRTTAANVPKRQAEDLAARAVVDFDDYYRERSVSDESKAGELMVISVDGKGVVVRPEDLRPATLKAAQARTRKLSKKLSKGEKRGSKRMATVAAVYTVDRFPRKAEDIVGEVKRVRRANTRRPKPRGKRVWASLEKKPGAGRHRGFRRGTPARPRQGEAVGCSRRRAEVAAPDRSTGGQEVQGQGPDRPRPVPRPGVPLGRRPRPHRGGNPVLRKVGNPAADSNPRRESGYRRRRDAAKRHPPRLLGGAPGSRGPVRRVTSSSTASTCATTTTLCRACLSPPESSKVRAATSSTTDSTSPGLDGRWPERSRSSASAPSWPTATSTTTGGLMSNASWPATTSPAISPASPPPPSHPRTTAGYGWSNDAFCTFARKSRTRIQFVVPYGDTRQGPALQQLLDDYLNSIVSSRPPRSDGRGTP